MPAMRTTVSACDATSNPGETGGWSGLSCTPARSCLRTVRVWAVPLHGGRVLKRDVPVLPPRVLDLLRRQPPQRVRHPAAGAVGHDDVVDEAAAGGDERVGEALAVFLGAGLDRGGVADVGAEDDLDRTLGTHHRDLGGGPGVVHVAAHVLA